MNSDEELTAAPTGRGDPPERSSGPASADGPWWVAALLALVAAVPVLAAAVRAGTSWMPLQDTAALVMRSSDLLTAETPLLGMPTSLSVTMGRPVHHPGPLGFWPSGLAHALVDHSAAAMVATVVVNVACIVGIVFIARRLGGPAVAGLAALLVALSTWSLRDEILIDPLNPYAGHLPLGLYLLATAAVASGRAWGLPVMVAAGSYAAQSHVSLLAPVGMVGIALLGWGAWAAVSHAGSRAAAVRGLSEVVREHRRPVLVAVVLAVVLWLPVLIDLVVRSHNLWYLARAGGGTGEESLGTSSTWDVVTRAITSPGWLRDDRVALDLVAPVGLGRHLVATAILLAAVALIVVALRRGHRTAPAALVVSLAALAGGGYALTRVPLNFWNVFSLYNYLWLWAASALLWGSLIAATGVLVGERLARREPVGRATVVVTGMLCVAVAAVSAGSGSARTNFAAQYVPPTAAIADQLATTLDPEGRYLLEIPLGIENEFVTMGVARELQRRGIEVLLPESLDRMVGAHRTVGDATVDTVLTFSQGLVLPPSPEDGVEVARFVPTPDDRATLDVIERELMDLIAARGSLTLATEPVRVHDLSQAEQIVASGELVGLWEFGVLTDPALPEDLMRRYRAALSLPVRSVVVYAHPAP